LEASALTAAGIGSANGSPAAGSSIAAGTDTVARLARP